MRLPRDHAGKCRRQEVCRSALPEGFDGSGRSGVSHIPIVVHQDHGTSPAVCQRSIQLGFTSVMMDGSLGTDGKTPMDYDYNASVTRQVVDMSHACGVSVEGELGCLGSLETGEAGEEDGVGAAGKLTHDQMLTDPDEAKQFVADTHVDALAIACGTSHGATSSPAAHGGYFGDRSDKSDSRQHPQYSPCHARLLGRSAGVVSGYQ